MNPGKDKRKLARRILTMIKKERRLEEELRTLIESRRRLFAAVVANWLDKTDDAPGHCHNIKGRWDKDGSECQWCKTWQEIRATVAANDGSAPPGRIK